MKFIKKVMVSVMLASLVAVGTGSLLGNTQKVNAAKMSIKGGWYPGAGSSADFPKKLGEYSFGM